MSGGGSALAGELAIFTAREVHAQLLALVDAAGEGGEIALDLSAVGEIDTAGLQLLLAAGRQAAAARCRLRLTSASPPVRELFELCGLAELLADPPSAAEA